MYELLDLPIPEKGIANDEIASCVEALLISGGDSEEVAIRLNLILYDLYGLNYDEVLVIAPNTPITREEYETYQVEHKSTV